jgi:hypothetical protein
MILMSASINAQSAAVQSLVRFLYIWRHVWHIIMIMAVKSAKYDGFVIKVS